MVIVLAAKDVWSDRSPRIAFIILSAIAARVDRTHCICAARSHRGLSHNLSFLVWFESRRPTCSISIKGQHFPVNPSHRLLPSPSGFSYWSNCSLPLPKYLVLLSVNFRFNVESSMCSHESLKVDIFLALCGISWSRIYGSLKLSRTRPKAPLRYGIPTFSFRVYDTGF